MVNPTEIEDILDKDPIYEKIEREDQKSTEINSEEFGRLTSEIERYNNPVYKFEKSVLSYLFKKQKNLGIEKIYELTNMRVDALLKLVSGRMILLEIKYALNWKNVCNARVEILRFFAEGFSKYFEKQPDRGLIIFNHFSGDWNRTTQNRRHRKGWNYFYEEESMLRGKFSFIPIDIVQLINSKLKVNPMNSQQTDNMQEKSISNYTTVRKV